MDQVISNKFKSPWSKIWNVYDWRRRKPLTEPRAGYHRAGALSPSKLAPLEVRWHLELCSVISSTEAAVRIKRTCRAHSDCCSHFCAPGSH